MNTGVKSNHRCNNHEKIKWLIIQKVWKYHHTVRFQNEKNEYEMNSDKLKRGLYFSQFTGNHGNAFILHDSPQKSHQNIPEWNKNDHPEFHSGW